MSEYDSHDWYNVTIHECVIPINTTSGDAARIMIEDFVKRGLLDLKITAIKDDQLNNLSPTKHK